MLELTFRTLLMFHLEVVHSDISRDIGSDERDIDLIVSCSMRQCRNGLGDFRHDHQMAIQISIPRAARVDGPDHETGNGHSLSLNDYLHVCALNRTFQCLFELERLSYVLHVISKIPIAEIASASSSGS